jgi:AbrB family looped-hinge helix DNA binding protein
MRLTVALKVKVSSKNQIAVPAAARARLGIGPGDTLLVEVREHSIVLMKEPVDFVEHMLGLHKDVWEGIDAQEYVDNERDAWKQ